MPITTDVIPKGVLNGLEKPPVVDHPTKGVWCWTNPKGWRVVAVHYTSDPDKDPATETGRAWKDKAKLATPSSRDWRREMEIDFTVSKGEPFYTDFSRDIHVQSLRPDPKLQLLRGWDFGRARPACVFAQKDHTNQIRVLYSMMGKNANIFKFAPAVIAETNARFPGYTITDYGDPSGAQETDKGATTAILLETFSIEIHARYSYIEEGIKMIEKQLLVRADGEPGIVVDPCNIALIDGFAGGYQLDTTATGKDREGRLKNKPKKDGYYDHLMDAVRYIIIHLFTFGDFHQARGTAAQALGLWKTNAEHRKEKVGAGAPWADFLC